METFSALLALCAGNSPVTGEFPARKLVTRSFDVFFDLHLNKRLSKQPWLWWIETPSGSLWHHRNVNTQNFSTRISFAQWCCTKPASGANISTSEYIISLAQIIRGFLFKKPSVDLNSLPKYDLMTINETMNFNDIDEHEFDECATLENMYASLVNWWCDFFKRMIAYTLLYDWNWQDYLKKLFTLYSCTQLACALALLPYLTRQCYSGYFRQSLWKSLGPLEISRVTLIDMYFHTSSFLHSRAKN